jgi:hypothetical protein
MGNDVEMNFREVGREAGSGPSSSSVTGFWVGGFTHGGNAK